MISIKIIGVLLALALSSQARTFTVRNNCGFTIWPAVFTDLSVGQSIPDHATGWEAPAGSSETFFVPNDWRGGRIWGRRDCDFTNNSGPSACASGGCEGGLECSTSNGIATSPVSIAEWTLTVDRQDFYDVSLVAGFNLPMQITNNQGCPRLGCPIDLNPICPSQLHGPTNAVGELVGCNNACTANLDGNPSNSSNCCTGSHRTPSTCPPSGVQFYSFFKGNCPNSFVYAFDESNAGPLIVCSSSTNPDYTLTFCP